MQPQPSEMKKSGRGQDRLPPPRSRVSLAAAGEGASHLSSWFLISAIHRTRGVSNNLSEPHCRGKCVCINKGGKGILKLN